MSWGFCLTYKNSMIMAEMTAIVATEIERAIANGAEQTELTGGIVDFDKNTLEKGDLFIIPENYVAFKQPINGSDKVFAQFIHIHMVDETGKTTGEVRNLYPTTFSKRRKIYDPTTKKPAYPSKSDEAKGDVVTKYKHQSTIAKGIEAVKGKIIQVTDVRTIETRDFNDANNTAQTKILDFNFFTPKAE